jgi:hypothetical protein
LRARPALGVGVGEQQSHYCDTEQNKTDRAHGSSPGPSFQKLGPEQRREAPRHQKGQGHGFLISSLP